MSKSGASRAVASPTALGFLTVVRHETHGLFGGYLLLNMNGRPLEFHCTAPVKASRAQEILFGPTLEPYLLGEQIGRTLVEKGSSEVQVVCTDQVGMLALREHVDLPVAWIVPPQMAPTEGDTYLRVDGPHAAWVQPVSFRLGSNVLTAARGFEADRERIEETLRDIGERFDLTEPFGRIREAIDEAQRSGR